jgi:hypothetical protein
LQKVHFHFHKIQVHSVCLMMDYKMLIKIRTYKKMALNFVRIKTQKKCFSFYSNKNMLQCRVFMEIYCIYNVWTNNVCACIDPLTNHWLFDKEYAREI